MTNRKNRFNLFKNNSFKSKFKNLWGKNKLKSDGNNKDKKGSHLNFTNFDSIIPENSPLKNNSSSSSGFYNDKFSSKDIFNIDEDLEGVDEKYEKYIYSHDCDDLTDFENSREVGSFNEAKPFNSLDYEESDLNFSKNSINNGYYKKKNIDKNSANKKNIKDVLLNFKNSLLNKDSSSKSLFGKIAIILIFLVLISSVFYFFIYQPFQNELNLEKNSKLNELNALYKGPLELNENFYSLENQINQAYDIDEIRSIDVLRYATKDWRIYHSSKIVSSKDAFGRVMMSYGESKNIIMSVKDANEFVRENDAKILSNVQFEKVNTVIVPISLSRLQATAGLISVGSVVDIYSLNNDSSEYDGYGDIKDESDSIKSEDNSLNNTLSSNGKGVGDNENLEYNSSYGSSSFSNLSQNKLEKIEEGPKVSGATVLAILRSKDSGLVDSTISISNTIIKGNQTNLFENRTSFSSDVEELLKRELLNSNRNNNTLDSYLMNYGIRLSNFERMSNLGDLDSEYIILLEVPQSDVNFVINNMDNLILTIPTDFAPNWAVSELSETYYQNLYQNQSLDLF